MESLYLLIPLSILLLLGGVGVYFWAVKSGQYDDLDGEGERILFDDEDDLTGSAPDRSVDSETQCDKKSQQDS